MALGGEVASMFVRLRPSLTGFAAEATAGVKATLSDVQAQVNATARANVSADVQTVDANLKLAASYKEIASAAKYGSEQQLVAARLAREATAAAESSIGASAVAARTRSNGLRASLFGVGGGAKHAEAEIGKASRGALAGSGVFRSLGRSLAFASGGFLAVASASTIVRESLSGAALLQKSGEAIRAQFGQAGEAIRRFAENGAAKLGISGGVAEQTAARFGILFKNLGIGQREASGMTIGFEKLAGSINAIKGGGAAGAQQVLQSIVLAAAGNTRGLKQLGIAIDSTQIKYAALKLGLISNVKDAITPAIKAQAIYALATAHLGDYLAQAKRHAGDYANVQARLSAEFSNAKDALGKALLPTFTRYATALANWLERMQKSGKLQRDFNAAVHAAVNVVKGVAAAVETAVHAFKAIVPLIGGTKNAVVLLMAAWAVSKVVGVAESFSKRIVPAVTNIKTSFAAAKGESVGAFATIRAGAIATAVTIKEALVTSAIGLLIVAVGIAVGYVITHWDQVKRYTVATGAAIVQVWQGVKTGVVGIAEVIGGTMTTYLTMPFRALLKAAEAASKISIFGYHPFAGVGKAASNLENTLNSFSTDLVGKGIDRIKKSASEFGKVGTAFTDSLHKQVNSTSVKGGLRATGAQAGKEIADAAAATATAGSASVAAAVGKGAQAAIDAAQQRIQNSVRSAKTNLDSIGAKLAETIAKILQKLGGTGGALAGSPQGQAFKKLKDLVSSGAPSFEIARASKELSSQLQNVGKTPAQTVKQRLADLTDQFNKGGIGLKTFNQRVNAILAENGASYKTAGKTGGRAFADAFRAEVQGLREQATAITAIPAKYRGVGGGGGDATIKIVRPLEVIQREQSKIAVTASKERARIAKAAEKAANVLQGMKATNVGPLPGFHKTLAGHAAKKAGSAAAAGVQP